MKAKLIMRGESLRSFILCRSPRFPGERMSVEARLSRVAQRHGEVLTTARRER